MTDRDAYLIVRSKASHRSFREFCDAAVETTAALGGTETARSEVHEIEAFEPGSVAMHCYIACFPSMMEAKKAWAKMDTRALALPEPPLVLAANAVPRGGFEDVSVPTQYTVLSPGSDTPTLLLVEGSATDQTRMDQYREIIFPLMFSGGGYYTVFELGGDVEVLSGNWNEAIFAISLWPTNDAARGFWLEEVYQRDAIPLRIDIGHFEVVTMAGTVSG